MANDSVASPAGRRPAAKAPIARPDPPEVRLARGLLNTEYAMRGRRLGGPARPRDTGSAWDQLADELRRFIDTLRGRSSARGGAPSAGGGSQAEGSSDRTGPEPAQAMPGGAPGQPLSPQSPHASREAFEGTISRLPPPAREAFEDAVLDLVRTEKKWRKAYNASPTSMPSVAMYANNAYLRELRRNAPPSAEPPPRTRGRSPGEVPRTATAAEAMTDAQNSIMARDREQFQRVRALWERPASGRRDSLTSSTGGGFAFPGENEMSDGLAFEGARRARYAPSVDSSRNPGQDQLSDAIGFQAAREASLARVTALPLGRTPAPVHEAEQAHHDGNDTAFDAPGREPLSDGHAFLAAGTAPLSGSPPPLPHALPSPMTPVSPLASPTVAATGEPRPLLSDAGRLAARDSISSTHTASTSRDAASPARSTPVATPVRTGQNTNATTPKARRV